MAILACGGSPERVAEQRLVPSGSCVALSDGGFDIAADAGGYADPTVAGPHADPSLMAGSWTVVAPTCLKGTLHDGVWTCGHGDFSGQRAWTGSIGAKPDKYYPGGLILTPWPDPSAWQYASEARVTYASSNEVHAALMDGYWGFFGSVMYFCK